MPKHISKYTKEEWEKEKNDAIKMYIYYAEQYV